MIVNTSSASSASKPTAPAHVAKEQLFANWLRSLAVVVANCSAYGVRHAVTNGSIDQCHTLLKDLHKQYDTVEIRIAKEGVQINNQSYHTTELLLKKLRKLPVHSVTMTRGINREDLGNLLILIYEERAPNEPDTEANFSAKLNASGIRNVSTNRIQLVELKPSEEIVSKDRLKHMAQGLAGGGGGAGSAGAAGGAGSGAAGYALAAGSTGSGAAVGIPVTDIDAWGKAWNKEVHAEVTPPAAPVATSAPTPPMAATAPTPSAPSALAPVTAWPAPVTSPPAPACSRTDAMPVAPGAPDTVSVQLPAAAVGQIIAFLSGTAVEPAAGEEAGKAVREAGNDPNQLANLIMKAVEARQQDHPLAAGETLGNIVADCLRRAVDGMKQAPGGQTQKAQRETMRTLTLVEKQIVDHIRKLNEEGKTPDDETVTVQSAVKEMKLQVEAESIAGQFAKQQSAAMDAEKAFAKFVAKNGPDVLEAAGIRTMLLEAGLAPEVWSRLVAASQQRAGKGARIKGTRNPGASDKSTDNQLTRLLADLVTDLEAGGTGQVRDDSFEKAMSRVDGEVVRLIAKTDSKIDALAEAVRKIALEEPKPAADSHEDASIDDGLSRRKLLNLMLEIVHEIRQPLAVIHSSIAMLQTPGVGVLSPVQQQLVALMGKSETRIGSLTERLERIM